jgi:hypothetical protein
MLSISKSIFALCTALMGIIGESFAEVVDIKDLRSL